MSVSPPSVRFSSRTGRPPSWSRTGPSHTETVCGCPSPVRYRSVAGRSVRLSEGVLIAVLLRPGQLDRARPQRHQPDHAREVSRRGPYEVAEIVIRAGREVTVD